MSPRGESKQEKGTQKRVRERVRESVRSLSVQREFERERALPLSFSLTDTGKRTIGGAKNERAEVEDCRRLRGREC